MRKVLALLTVAVMLGLTTSAALAYSPSVDGTVTQVFTYNSFNGTPTIAVDGTPYPVPFDFYSRVHVGDAVQFDGTNWTIAK